MTGHAPLRVGVLVTRLAGGAGVVAVRGALAVLRRGCRVVVLTGGGGRLIDEAREAGIEVVVEPSLRPDLAPADDLRAVLACVRFLRAQRFDVVHTHCAKAGAIGRIAARWVRVPRVVHTYHGFPFHPFQSALRRRAYLAVERRLGRRTDVAIGVGAQVSAEAVRRGLVAGHRIRTSGVPVAAPARVGSTARARARRALGIEDSAVVVGVVARVTYQKAPEDFVRALALLARPEVLGVWIGDGELVDPLRARVAEMSRPPAVRFLGDRADVGELLPAFDVFALPSRYEGLPLAIVEAMRAGVPVVATAVNAVPQVVVPGETGLLVAPERPDELASAIAHLLDHPESAARMACAARAVAETHTTADLAGLLAEVYGLPGEAEVSGADADRVSHVRRLWGSGPASDRRSPRARDMIGGASARGPAGPGDSGGTGHGELGTGR